MARAIEELRVRREFVVLYRPGPNAEPKRTPVLSLLDALDWYRIVTGQDPGGRYQLVTACRSVMACPLMRAAGCELVN